MALADIHKALSSVTSAFEPIEKRNPWWSQQPRDKFGRWSSGYVHGAFSPVNQGGKNAGAAPHVTAPGTAMGIGGDVHGKSSWQFNPKWHGQESDTAHLASGQAPKGDPHQWGFTVGGGGAKKKPAAPQAYESESAALKPAQEQANATGEAQTVWKAPDGKWQVVPKSAGKPGASFQPQSGAGTPPAKPQQPASVMNEGQAKQHAQAMADYTGKPHAAWKSPASSTQWFVDPAENVYTDANDHVMQPSAGANAPVGSPEAQAAAGNTHAAHLQNVHEQQSAQVPTSSAGLGSSFGAHVKPPEQQPVPTAAGGTGAQGSVATAPANTGGLPDVSSKLAPYYDHETGKLEHHDFAGHKYQFMDTSTPEKAAQISQVLAQNYSQASHDSSYPQPVVLNGNPGVLIPHHPSNGGPDPKKYAHALAALGASSSAAPISTPGAGTPGATGEFTDGFAHVDGWKPTEGAKHGGTNPGGFFEAPDGSKHYVKFYSDPDQARTEFIANEIYRKLGIHAPKSRLVRIGNGLGVANEVVKDGSHLTSAHKSMLHKHDDIKRGFVADAFLSNRDVIGANHDNIMLSGGNLPGTSTAHRIDNGGSLLFRAMGGKKSLSWNTIPELETMRDAQIAPQAGPAFKDLTESDLKTQAEHLVKNLTPETIESLVKKSGMSGDVAEATETALLNRRKYLADEFLAPKGFSSDSLDADGKIKPGSEAAAAIPPMKSPEQLHAWSPHASVSIGTSSKLHTLIGKHGLTPDSLKEFAENPEFYMAAYKSKFYGEQGKLTATLLAQTMTNSTNANFSVVQNGNAWEIVAMGKKRLPAGSPATSGASPAPFDLNEVLAAKSDTLANQGYKHHEGKWHEAVVLKEFAQTGKIPTNISEKSLGTLAAKTYGDEHAANLVAAMLSKGTGKEWHAAPAGSDSYSVENTDKDYNPESSYNKYAGMPTPEHHMEMGGMSPWHKIITADTIQHPDDLPGASQYAKKMGFTNLDNFIQGLHQHMTSGAAQSNVQQKEKPNATNGAFSQKLETFDERDKARKFINRVLKKTGYSEETYHAIASNPLAMRWLSTTPHGNYSAKQLAEMFNKHSPAFHAEVLNAQEHGFHGGSLLHFSHHETVAPSSVSTYQHAQVKSALAAAVKQLKATHSSGPLTQFAEAHADKLHAIKFSGPQAQAIVNAVNANSDKYAAYATPREGGGVDINMVPVSSFGGAGKNVGPMKKPLAFAPFTPKRNFSTTPLTPQEHAEQAQKPSPIPAHVQSEIDDINAKGEIPSNASMPAKIALPGKLPQGVVPTDLWQRDPDKQAALIGSLSSKGDENGAKWLAEHFNLTNDELQHHEAHLGKFFPGKEGGYPSTYETPTNVLSQTMSGEKKMPDNVKPWMLYASNPAQQSEALNALSGFGHTWLKNYFEERQHAEEHSSAMEQLQEENMKDGAPSWHYGFNGSPGSTHVQAGTYADDDGIGRSLDDLGGTHEASAAKHQSAYNASPFPLMDAKATVNGNEWDMRALSPSEVKLHEGASPATGATLKSAIQDKAEQIAAHIKAKYADAGKGADVHEALPSHGVHPESRHTYNLSQEHFPSMLAMARALLPSRDMLESIADNKNGQSYLSPQGRARINAMTQYALAQVANHHGVPYEGLRNVDKMISAWKGSPQEDSAQRFRVMANMLSGRAPWDNVDFRKHGKTARDIARNAAAYVTKPEFMAMLAHKAVSQALAERLSDEEGHLPQIRGISASEYGAMTGNKHPKEGDKVHGSSKSHAGFTTNASTAQAFGGSKALLRYVKPAHVWHHYLAPTVGDAKSNFHDERETFAAVPHGGSHYVYRNEPQTQFKENQVFSLSNASLLNQKLKEHYGILKAQGVRPLRTTGVIIK